MGCTAAGMAAAGSEEVASVVDALEPAEAVMMAVVAGVEAGISVAMVMATAVQ